MCWVPYQGHLLTETAMGNLGGAVVCKGVQVTTMRNRAPYDYHVSLTGFLRLPKSPER